MSTQVSSRPNRLDGMSLFAYYPLDGQHFTRFIMDDMHSTPIAPHKTKPSPDDGRWLRLVILLWIAMAVAVCVKSITKGGEHTVYPVLAWGSRHWWMDQPLHAEYPDKAPDIYRYSPTLAIVFTPLALLPDWLGASLWGALSVTATLCALRLLVREILPGSWPPDREAWFLGLALFGSMSGIWSGQSNSLILAMVIFAVAAIKRNRWWTASVLLAIPVFIKIWPIMIVLLLMVFWPRQLGWRCALVGIGLALLPFLTRPFSVVLGQYQEWHTSLVSQSHHRWGGFRDAWTIWENLWPPVSRHGYQVLQLVSAFAMFVWCYCQLRRVQCFLAAGNEKGDDLSLAAGKRSPTSQDAAFRFLTTAAISIWVSWQMLFGPGTEQLTYGLIAPSAAWALLASVQEKRHRFWAAATWSCLAFFSCGDIEKIPLRIHPAATMILPLAVISFAVWLILETARSPLAAEEKAE